MCCMNRVKSSPEYAYLIYSHINSFFPIVTLSPCFTPAFSRAAITPIVFSSFLNCIRAAKLLWSGKTTSLSALELKTTYPSTYRTFLSFFPSKGGGGQGAALVITRGACGCAHLPPCWPTHTACVRMPRLTQWRQARSHTGRFAWRPTERFHVRMCVVASSRLRICGQWRRGLSAGMELMASWGDPTHTIEGRHGEVTPPCFEACVTPVRSESRARIG